MVQSLIPWLVETAEAHDKNHGTMGVFDQVLVNKNVQIVKKIGIDPNHDCGLRWCELTDGQVWIRACFDIESIRRYDIAAEEDKHFNTLPACRLNLEAFHFSVEAPVVDRPPASTTKSFKQKFTYGKAALVLYVTAFSYVGQAVKLAKVSKFSSRPQICTWIQQVEKNHLDSLEDPVVKGLNLRGQRFDAAERLNRGRMGLNSDEESEDDDEEVTGKGKGKSKGKEKKKSDKENEDVSRDKGEALRRAWLAPGPLVDSRGEIMPLSSPEKSTSAAPPKAKPINLGKPGGWSDAESEEESVTTKSPQPTSTKKVQNASKIKRCQNWGSSDDEEVVVTTPKKPVTLGISKPTSTPVKKLESKIVLKKIDWSTMSSSPSTPEVKMTVHREVRIAVQQLQVKVGKAVDYSSDVSEAEVEERSTRKRVYSPDFDSGCESQEDSGFVESQYFDYSTEETQEEEEDEIKIEMERQTEVEPSRKEERVEVSKADIRSPPRRNTTPPLKRIKMQPRKSETVAVTTYDLKTPSPFPSPSSSASPEPTTIPAAGQHQSPPPTPPTVSSSGNSTLPEVSPSNSLEIDSQLEGPPAGRQGPREELSTHEEEDDDDDDDDEEEMLSSPAKSIKLEVEDSASDSDEEEEDDVIFFDMVEVKEEARTREGLGALDATREEMEAEDSLFDNIAAPEALLVSKLIEPEAIEQEEDGVSDREETGEVEMEENVEVEVDVEVLDNIDMEERTGTAKGIQALDKTTEEVQAEDTVLEKILAPKSHDSVGGTSLPSAEIVLADKKPVGVMKRKRGLFSKLSLADFKRMRHEK